jgi:hypothetical protein
MMRTEQPKASLDLRKSRGQRGVFRYVRVSNGSYWRQQRALLMRAFWRVMVRLDVVRLIQRPSRLPMVKGDGERIVLRVDSPGGENQRPEWET